MRDQRAEALAKILVQYSTRVQKGDVCVIQSTTAAEPLVQAIYEEVLRAGGLPVMQLTTSGAQAAFYELASDHFKETRGYEAYGNAVDLLRAIGLERMCEMYLGVQAWGTPAQVLERLRARREVIGPFDLTACFRFAGVMRFSAPS